jgi:hypothetical protein
MHDTTDQSDDIEQSLRQRFQRLREAERSDLPAFPSGSELLRRPAEPAANPAFRLGTGLALAASALLAVIIWVNRPAENAVEIYVDIMANAASYTDPLLQVSSGALPEIGSPAPLLEMEIPSLPAN